MSGEVKIGAAGSSSSSSQQQQKKDIGFHGRLPLIVKEFIAGGVAGGCAKTAVAPLERVKILFQTNATSFQKVGVFRSLTCIYRAEGLPGFFRGNGASVTRVVPYAALHFMAYEQYRRWISEAMPEVRRNPVTDLVAGSLAGATAVVSTYPLDLVRTRLAIQVAALPDTTAASTHGVTAALRPQVVPVAQPVYRGMGDAFLGTFREGGVRALYRGLSPTLYGIFPYAGLKFYVYETLRESLPGPGEPSIAVKLTCGAVAGLIGQTATYPLDVVRRQMQAQGPHPVAGEVHYKSTWDGLTTIVRTQGWRYLYAGLSLNYIKVLPSTAIGFTVYDAMKSFLHVPPRERGPRAVTISK